MNRRTILCSVIVHVIGLCDLMSLNIPIFGLIIAVFLHILFSLFESRNIVFCNGLCDWFLCDLVSVDKSVF